MEMISTLKGKIHKILFVCRANRCRSQIAEAFFNRLADGLPWRAFSAGAEENKIGKLSESNSGPCVILSMKDCGFDLEENYTKPLTPEVVRRANMIICMAELEFCPLYILDDPKVIFWQVRNPQIDYDDICLVRDQIEILVRELLESIK
ncbi:MAG: hypothetical protein HYZ69_03945 [Candidatus Colwellbacteria bacterium]|nr:hypothetical protein [Candidatus Colwellbacteria bacterium]